MHSHVVILQLMPKFNVPVPHQTGQNDEENIHKLYDAVYQEHHVTVCAAVCLLLSLSLHVSVEEKHSGNTYFQGSEGHRRCISVTRTVHTLCQQIIDPWGGVTKPLARLLEPLRIATILNIYLSNGM